MAAIFLVSSGMFVMGYVLFGCFLLFNTDFFSSSGFLDVMLRGTLVTKLQLASRVYGLWLEGFVTWID